MMNQYEIMAEILRGGVSEDEGLGSKRQHL